MKTEEIDTLPYNRGSDIAEAEMVYREFKGSLGMTAWETAEKFQVALAEYKEDLVRGMMRNSLNFHEKRGRATDLNFAAGCLAMDVKTLAEILGVSESDDMDQCFVNPFEIACRLGYPEIAQERWSPSGKDKVTG